MGRGGTRSASSTITRGSVHLHSVTGSCLRLLCPTCSCGFAGCCLIRLTIGLHHYPDILSLQDEAIRAAVELRCLKLGQQLLKLRAQAASAAAGAAGHMEASGGGAVTLGVAAIDQLQQQQGDEQWEIQHIVQLVQSVCDGWLDDVSGCDCQNHYACDA